MTGHPATRARAPGRRRAFAGLAVLLTVSLVLALAEGALRWRPEVLGFERLAYLPEPLKRQLGPRFVRAYRHTARAYFASHTTAPRLVRPSSP